MISLLSDARENCGDCAYSRIPIRQIPLPGLTCDPDRRCVDLHGMCSGTDTAPHCILPVAMAEPLLAKSAAKRSTLRHYSYRESFQ